jgi:hypothetical protein
MIDFGWFQCLLNRCVEDEKLNESFEMSSLIDRRDLPMEFDRCSLATSDSRVRDLAKRVNDVGEGRKCSSSLATYCEMTNVRDRWVMVFSWNLFQLLNREHYEHAEKTPCEATPYMGTRTVSIDCADGMKHDSIGISMLSVI